MKNKQKPQSIKKILAISCMILLLVIFPLNASTLPFTGAQVFIEPGQTKAYIDRLFMTMKENGMTMCRIRMFESYMRTTNGKWDFSLFDKAFKAAQKYGVKIYCTFFPATDKLDIGGWKFPYDELQWIAFKDFIKNLTLHYKDHEALAGWVLINEPGIGGGNYPHCPFLNKEREIWDLENPEQEFTDKGFPILMNTRDQQFVNYITTKFLRDIAMEIKKYDTKHDIHVNPAGVFSNYGDYDFPAWRTFLTSLGGSAHPSWHFSDFKRDEYAFAMLTLSEMLRSGAGDKHWFMTEIQGGNNTYSGNNALCPTPNEISQWLWTIIGCEGKGGIFWMLNPRASGIEAGEWALLNYQNKPSERMKAAKKVSDIINNHPDVFTDMHEIPSGVDILYLKESLWAENRIAKSIDNYEGRSHGAVFKSAVSCFRALSERGLNIGLKEFSEYDFTNNNYENKTIIIANQIALPPQFLFQLEHFVDNGGTLIVEGLTGYFDNNLHAQFVTGFPFSKLFGDEISEVILNKKLFYIEDSSINLPTHLWYSTFANHSKKCLETRYGKGKVVWIPCNIALGARIADNYEALSNFLYNKASINNNTIRFDKYYRNLILRTLNTNKGKLLICISNSKCTEAPIIKGIHEAVNPEILYANQGCYIEGNKIVLSSGSTCILLLKKK